MRVRVRARVCVSKVENARRLAALFQRDQGDCVRIVGPFHGAPNTKRACFFAGVKGALCA